MPHHARRPHMNRRDYVLAWLSPGEVDHVFAEFLTGQALHDIHSGARNFQGTIAIESGPRIHETRCQVVDAFLGSPDVNMHPWLVMVDSDMAPESDAIHDLIETADSEGIKVLGGLCFAGGRTKKLVPTVYRPTEAIEGLSVEPMLDY